MKEKRLFAVIAVLAAALAVFLLTRPGGTTEKAQPAPSGQTETAEPGETGTEKSGQAAEAEDQPVQEQPFLVQITDDDPSAAYVLVRMPDPIGLLPLPTEGEYSRTIRQTMPDGSEAFNTLRLTPDGFRMEDANCEGHDCINEGEVTLENREERVLWNMVICLPHQLSLELITREEALNLLGR